MAQVIRVDFQRKHISIVKRRRCSHSRIEVHEQEGIVMCAACRQQLDAVHVLAKYVRRSEEIFGSLKKACVSQAEKSKRRKK